MVGRFILGALWIPDHDVGVGPRDYPPLPGVEVVDLGSVGAGDRHKLVLVQFTSDLHSFWNNQI